MAISTSINQSVKLTIKIPESLRREAKAVAESTYSHEEVWAEIETLESQGALPD